MSFTPHFCLENNCHLAQYGWNYTESSVVRNNKEDGNNVLDLCYDSKLKKKRILIF